MAEPIHPSVEDFRTAARMLRRFAERADEIAEVMAGRGLEKLTEGNIGSSVLDTMEQKISGWLGSASQALIKTEAADLRRSPAKAAGKAAAKQKS